MSAVQLKPNNIYIALYIRQDPPIPNDFHWALYLHLNPATSSGGRKFHIRNQGQGWIVEHCSTAGIMKEFLLVGLIRIANIPFGSEAEVDKLLRSCDNRIDLPETTCRVWLFWVLRELQKPLNDGTIVLKCVDLNFLEKEILQWGNENANSASQNVQPRPVAESSVF